jgi:succinylglutamate desuccinylase
LNQDRLIGKVEGDYPGPLIIIIGGLHGNEDSGVIALEQVFKTIQQEKIPIKGKLLGLKGNIEAIKSGSRFIDYDMNRCWYDHHIHALLFGQAKRESSEDYEVLDLLEWIHGEAEGRFASKVIMDLHATSSENGVFIVIPQEESRLEIPESMNIPIIFGLEKKIGGTLLNFFPSQDFISFAFEGGLIGSEIAVKLHMTGVWDVLFSSGCIEVEREERHHDVLEYIRNDQMPHPTQVSIQYRHAINRQDEFKMLPGFANFQSVLEGEVLAMDRSGKVKSPMDGLIIMPLYQDSGNDGFFIAEKLK